MTDLHEDVFDSDSGWTKLCEGPRFFQRYLINGPIMFTETTTVIRARPDAVRDAIFSRWDWWKHGRCDNYTQYPDGTHSYDLWPVGFGVHVHEVAQPPEELNDSGWRIRINVDGHCKGLAYFVIKPEGSATETTTSVTGRLAGVKIQGLLPRFFGTKGFALRHLGAERGEPGFPFRKGTGWVGLIDRLENSSSSH